jgi:hypothetical protein
LNQGGKTVKNRARIAASACLGVLAGLQVASAGYVGRLESIDVEVVQDGVSLFSFQNIATTGKLDGQDIYLGMCGTTQVSLRVQTYQPNVALIEDRWMEFTLRGTDATGTNPANLLNANAEGPLEVRLTNMKFDNVDGVNGNRVEPFQPGQYMPYPLTELPFFYLLDEYRGFVNLPGSERYSPSEPYPYNLGGYARPSIQVPMDVAANPAWGYGFSQIDNGFKTGFAISGIPDFGGAGPAHIGAFALTPILLPAVPPYFDVSSVPSAADAGFVSEIGIDLNMRGFEVPEPATLLMLLIPMMFQSRRHRCR